MSAFHAYDIRGIYNVDLDKDLVYKVGYFIPKLLKADKVLVGRDCRKSSDEMHDYLIKGITDAGADVYDIGLSTTPMVYFGTANYNLKASVQITASHNPKEYNGMKVSCEYALPVGYDTGLSQIEAWINNNEPTPVAEKRGEVHLKDLHKEYLDFLLKYKVDFSSLKIAFDLSNGMSTLFAKEIFGDEPEYIFDTMDGTFPNHDPNPLVPKNIVALQELVRKTGADVGVIYDGDADRAMFVDEKGNFVSPDLMIAVLGHYFIEERHEPGIVIQDIRSSKAIGEYLEPMGATMYTWKVGRANAARKLRELGGVWGGDLAGHYYFKDFFYSDSGLLASILVLRVLVTMKKKGLTLSQIIGNISHYQSSGEVNFKLEAKKEAMIAVKEHFEAKEKPVKVMDFDGYRAEFPDWWFNIRPSNTEPYLRFICEANSKELLDEKVNEVKNILKTQFNAEF